MKSKYILILNLFFYLYFLFSIINTYKNLEQINGTIYDAHKYCNRMYLYSFNLKEYNNTFIDLGRGLLHSLTDNKKSYQKIRFQSNVNKNNAYIFNNKDFITTNDVIFYVHKKDMSFLNKNKDIFYFGFHFADAKPNMFNKIIDCYYYQLRGYRLYVFPIITFLFFLLIFFCLPTIKASGFTLKDYFLALNIITSIIFFTL